MLIGGNRLNNRYYYNNKQTMFAHLRSSSTDSNAAQSIAIEMRDNVRSHVTALSGLDPSNCEVADTLAEIWLREFACTLNTLQQVNQIAARYHEHAFDNLDAYTAQEVQPAQLAPHEMTAEQRHASQLLLGVGRNHTEVNAALKSVELTARDVTDHNVASMRILAQQFQENQSVAEDAFDRLQHVTKQVWSLVNMLAFSNLFRFADPRQPICIPNQDDAIFIPYIPMKTFQ
jgi:hypothetical protein